MANHILKKFDADLGALIARLFELDDLVAAQFEHAMTLLVKCHREHGPEVIALEERINALHLAIDNDAAQLIVQHQPNASDLRVVLATTRIAAELEEIANAITRLGGSADRIHRAGRKDIRHLDSLDALRTAVQSMLQDWRAAFSARDAAVVAKSARACAAAQETWQELEALLVESLHVAHTGLGPHLGVETLRIAEALREIAERAALIAAHVAYMARGEDYRHRSPEQLDQIFPAAVPGA
ncbi:hypothetical protein GCM10025771_04240 [Niveibacterium umoris]|uniref:Phosphate transport system protein n=1 Tax=Niveibacterium umoris TaxID=1193620 RepID=A0A840BM00_9RHOO|nr:PhoU domain-containing protein [Niveibacterium umoris]MBB4014030.1 phosphate transport system protein [Niveibacterium umoris]